MQNLLRFSLRENSTFDPVYFSGGLQSGSIQQQRKRWDEDLSFEERKVIEKFIQLPADKRRIIGDIIETYYSTLED